MLCALFGVSWCLAFSWWQHCVIRQHSLRIFSDGSLVTFWSFCFCTCFLSSVLLPYLPPDSPMEEKDLIWLDSNLPRFILNLFVMSCQLPTAHLSNSKIPEEKPTHLKFYSFEVICKFENMSTSRSPVYSTCQRYSENWNDVWHLSRFYVSLKHFSNYLGRWEKKNW